MKIDIKELVRTVGATLSKHSPEILTGIGITSMIAGAVVAVRETPKAMQNIEAEKERQDTLELSLYDTLKVTWRNYLLATFMELAGVACIIGGTKVSGNRNAALAAAYTLTDQALRDYQQKAPQVVGEKKDKEIRAEVAKSQLERGLPNAGEFIDTGHGKTAFYDPIAKKRFYHDISKIERGVLDFNTKMRNETYCSLGEWYDIIDLDGISTDISDKFIWDINDGPFEISFNFVKWFDDTPYVVVEYERYPKPMFR